MCKMVEIGKFSGFAVDHFTSLSHLQYANVTLLIGKATSTNIWAFKEVLRNFELVSGLKVNFVKSCQFGMNVGAEFLQAASNFLYYKMGQLPFTYLGLPIGANRRRVSTWQPVVESLRKRLAR